ncbi:rhombotarget lipoprotein [Massilia niabensis]|uniref:Rhombotarget lipoprotein n=1 Tax=Massilia niabensis TaxID=544910 RepID=A0ABW0L6P8_9BURK
MRFLRFLLLLTLAASLAACASVNNRGARHAGSIVDFLYPKASVPPSLAPTVTELRLPVRVGIAFVPGTNRGMAPSEQEKQQMLERVKGAFSSHAYIGKIEVIPSSYLRAGGGFDNLDQVARMFDVDVVTLLSYDQVRFHDTNELAVLYWSIVGAYLIAGDQYDVQTLLDAAVFDVKSRKLLFRAPGSSQVKGMASLVAFSEEARAAQSQGYNEALARLVPQLQTELGNFRERVKSNPQQFKVEREAGYKGGGDAGWLAALAAVAVLLVKQRRAA